MEIKTTTRDTLSIYTRASRKRATLQASTNSKIELLDVRMNQIL